MLTTLSSETVTGRVSPDGSWVAFVATTFPFDGGYANQVHVLELAPIDLDLLGLFVDTSAICLDVTAIEPAATPLHRVLGETIGLGKGSVTLEDIHRARLLVVVGPPGTDPGHGRLVERTGVFGGDLLAVTTSGGVWRVSSARTSGATLKHNPMGWPGVG